jgi:hypothetical protein
MFRGVIMSRRKKVFSRFATTHATAVIAISLLTTQLYGQAFYGSVVGTVADQSSAALRGSQLTLTNTGTDERRQTQSDGEGNYQFLNLVPGTYRLAVEQAGFKRATLDQIQVTVAGTVRADVQMQLGDVTQTIEVRAQAALLQTESANLSQVVETRAVQELPVNGRNLLNLVALVPGVVPQGSTDGNALTGKNVFAAGNYQIGGGIANQSSTYFDGVPANAGVGNLTVLVPSPDVVSEFRVQTSSNSAEYGRYAGGVINIASKSGSNAFHGSAYEFLRNRALNANSFFANANNTGKPAFTQNQFGATAGGPVKKDRIFFFAGYEGYRQRQGANFLATVPLPAMYGGDFSGYRNASNAVIPIYDPLTQCGKYANDPCGSGTIQRTQFPGNIIPASRINPVAAKMLAFPIFANPNQPGAPYTAVANYTKNISSGGDNDQYTGRFDYNVTEKLRMFGRYTRWSSANVPADLFGNGIYGGDPYSPETFVTTTAVTGFTWLPNATTVIDIRASYGRWSYLRVQPFTGISMSKTFGLPAYFDTQLPIIHGIANETSVPSYTIGNYSNLSGQPGYNNAKITSTDNDFVLLPTVSKVWGRHTFKVGADLRDLQNNYYQATAGGTFTFDNLFTSQNALSAGASGNGLASMLLGYGASGNELSFGLPYQSLSYQGYFAQDTWQVTPKFTLTLGVRWEIPGVYKERFNRAVSFDPYELNPATKGILVNGNPVVGALDIIGSPQHPEKGLKTEHFRLFAPRVGVAYRMNDKTVIRAGGGIYYLPANLQFNEGPYGNALNQFTNPWVTSLDSSVTPLYSLSDPFPTGFIPSLGNIPSQYQARLIGAGPAAQLASTPYPYNEQWNFTLQRQTWSGIAVEAAYAGSHGVHLPRGSWQADALPTKYLSLGSTLNDQVPNPFFGLVQTGTLSVATVKRGQLLLPFPQYTGVSESGGYLGNANYHSLQMKVEKRFSEGGTVLAAYTFSKLIGDVESLTSWLDTGVGATSLQDPNNLKAEKAISGFDSRQRLAVSYALDLPVGKGKRFLNGGNSAVQKFTSGWTMSGTTTLQMGFPLALTATPNVTGFNLGLRPNVVPGCNPVTSGSAQSRLLKWFDPSCFTVPAAYTLGNESRTDSRLRGPGTANYNVSLFKKTALTERFNLEFRAEVFNLFNRVQFAQPNAVITTAANPTTGYVTSQLNQPRLIQLALRLVY